MSTTNEWRFVAVGYREEIWGTKQCIIGLRNSPKKTEAKKIMYQIAQNLSDQAPQHVEIRVSNEPDELVIWFGPTHHYFLRVEPRKEKVKTQKYSQMLRTAVTRLRFQQSNFATYR